MELLYDGYLNLDNVLKYLLLQYQYDITCCPETLLKGACLKSSAIKEHLIAAFLSFLSWKDNSQPL